MSLYAETNGYVEYDDRSHKLLSANRDFYLRQSAMTVNGRVPTPEEVRAAMRKDRSGLSPASIPSPPTEQNDDDEFPDETDPRDPDLPAPEGWQLPAREIRF